jgi:hypothetical protein
MTKPSAGEVFRYPFLWKREQMAGETEGRKARPVWASNHGLSSTVLCGSQRRHEDGGGPSPASSVLGYGSAQKLQ